MANLVKRLEETIAAWSNVSVHAHRFGGTEFRLGSAEIGHIHPGGVVDIPFPRPVRDALLAEGLAQEHRWVPNSGWTTFRARNEQDLQHALWLMRLSYLRYALKSAPDPRELLERESASLPLSPRFRALFDNLVAARITRTVETADQVA